MRLLAFDTSSATCSVALLDTSLPIGANTFELHKTLPMQQGRLILPLIQEVLAEASVTIHDIDAVAFGRGPGSFTGIRIASCVAQGIGFAANCRIIPISSLAALAQAAYLEQQWKYLWVVLDAHMGEVYWAKYAVNASGAVELVGSECLSRPEAIDMTGSDQFVAVGDGWAHMGLTPQLVDVKQVSMAQAIMTLANIKFERGDWVETSAAMPVYLR